MNEGSAALFGVGEKGKSQSCSVSSQFLPLRETKSKMTITLVARPSLLCVVHFLRRIFGKFQVVSKAECAEQRFGSCSQQEQHVVVVPREKDTFIPCM